MKVFERIVKEKLLSLTVDFLDPRQRGFLEQKYCITNMVVFCDSLAMSLNENVLSHVVYFDFAKAFDSVNHDILLQTTHVVLQGGALTQHIKAPCLARYAFIRRWC